MKRLFIACAALAVFAAACASSEAVKPLPTRAEGQEGQGDESLRRGNVAGAKRRYEAALREYRRADNLPGVSAVFIKMGKAGMLEGNYPLAADYFEQALRIAERENLKALAAEAALAGAMAELARGDIPRAEAAVAAAVSAGIGGWKRENAHGRLAMAKGDTDGAKKHFMAALDAAHSAKDNSAESACLGNLGLLFIKTGAPDAALTHLNRALALDKADEAVTAIGETLHLIGMAYEAKKDYPAARYFYVRAYAVNSAGSLERRAAEDQAAVARIDEKMKEAAPER
ncbi:MAG: tetratricopeptide repeat protein [Nitrospinae bacterium]|nr:tetratricopeptide repeat protein [Nitrospinota bacterium]